MAKTLIVIDPGHGGKDPGASGNGLVEKHLALDLSKRVAFKLQQYQNVEVKLIREDDRLLTLQERADIANRLRADFFLSIHINAGGGTGFESYIHTGSGEKTQALRAEIHAEIRKYLDTQGIFDRGGKFANFAVLRETDMPAMLLECLFIDNATDAALLKQSDVLDDLAGAIVAGLVRTFNLNPQTDALAAAVDALVKAGIISSKFYWLANAVPGKVVSGSDARSLILKMAAKLSERGE